MCFKVLIFHLTYAFTRSFIPKSIACQWPLVYNLNRCGIASRKQAINDQVLALLIDGHFSGQQGRTAKTPIVGSVGPDDIKRRVVKSNGHFSIFKGRTKGNIVRSQIQTIGLCTVTNHPDERPLPGQFKIVSSQSDYFESACRKNHSLTIGRASRLPCLLYP